MAKKPQTLTDYQELAARALCRKAGLPENIKRDGVPMWETFLGEVNAVFEAIDLEGLLSARSELASKPPQQRM